jgi:hypothetical protein
MFLYLPMILLLRCHIAARVTTIDLRTLVKELIRRQRLLGALIRRPTGTTSKPPADTTAITTVIDATVFSIGLGSTLNNFADRLLPARRGTWVAK